MATVLLLGRNVFWELGRGRLPLLYSFLINYPTVICIGFVSVWSFNIERVIVANPFISEHDWSPNPSVWATSQ